MQIIEKIRENVQLEETEEISGGIMDIIMKKYPVPKKNEEFIRTIVKKVEEVEDNWKMNKTKVMTRNYLLHFYKTRTYIHIKMNKRNGLFIGELCEKKAIKMENNACVFLIEKKNIESIIRLIEYDG